MVLMQRRMRITNLTDDTLTAAGHEIGPGDTVEMDDGRAQILVTRNPKKFAAADEPRAFDRIGRLRCAGRRAGAWVRGARRPLRLSWGSA